MGIRIGGVVLALTVLGCGDGDGDDTGAGLCSTNVLQQSPEDGATGVFSRTQIDFTIARAEPDASITLTDSGGAEVPGSLELVDDVRLSFRPDAPLTSGESYTATLNWSCSETKPIVNTFTVGDAGTTAIDAATLVDRTWIADLKSGTYIAPTGIGGALDRYVEAQILLAVDGESGDELQLSAGAADYNDDQDLCSDTSVFDAPADFSANPYFTVTEPDILLVVLGDRLDIRDLTLTGGWTIDGSQIVGVRLDGILDTRDLKEELDVTEDDGVCNLFGAAYNVKCEECPDASGPYCMRLIISDLTLEEAAYDMVPRTLEEIAEDPECSPATP